MFNELKDHKYEIEESDEWWKLLLPPQEFWLATPLSQLFQVLVFKKEKPLCKNDKIDSHLGLYNA